MKKAYLILKHKHLQMIERVDFFIMILIAPVLALLGIGISELVLMLIPLRVVLN